MNVLSHRVASLMVAAAFVSLLSVPTAAQPSNATLHGDYIATTYFNDAVDGPSTSLATIHADGNGDGSWTVTASSNGDTGAGVLTYSVSDDATLTMTVDGEPLRGIIAPSGEALTAVELDPGAFGIHVALHVSSGLTNADLTGDYALVQYFNDAVDGLNTAFSVVTFDGAGGGTFDVQLHSAGETGSGPFTYTLAADGRLTILADGSALEGVYNPAARAMTLVETEPGAFGIYFGVQTSSGNTLATLDGEYGVVRYESEGVDALAAYASLTFDGAGAATLQTIESSDGDSGSEPLTYAVNDDGTFEIPEAGTTQGIVDASGGWFAFAQLGPAQLGAVMGFKVADTGTGNEDGASTPEGFALTIGPNPSNRPVLVRVEMPRSAQVRLEVFDLLGRRVAVLTDALLPAGAHVIPWDAVEVQAGHYLVRLAVDQIILVKRLTRPS